MKAFWHAAKDQFSAVLLRLRYGNGLAGFSHGANCAQNAVDIFDNEWVGSFPPSLQVEAGGKALYDDGRIRWLDQQLPMKGLRVLELGPMEASHTYQMLQCGAKEVVAIEANQRAFLKCLIAKELLDLRAAHFRCGDFIDCLEADSTEYDVCAASGVLYHMREPLRLLCAIARRASTVFLWTHYYDQQWITSHPGQAHRFGKRVQCEQDGFVAEGIERRYGAQVWNPMHLGGHAKYAIWLPRQTILDGLAFYGFDQILIGDDTMAGEAGPAITLLASKSKPPLGTT